MIYIDYDPEKAGSAATTPTYLSGVTKTENGQTTSWSIELKPGRNVFDVNGGNKTAELVRSHDNYKWYEKRGAIIIDESDIDLTLEDLETPITLTGEAAPNVAVTPAVNTPGTGTEGEESEEETAPPPPPPTPSPSSKTPRAKKIPESELPTSE